MQERFTVQWRTASSTAADRLVKGDCVGPLVGVVVAQVAPGAVPVVRAADTRGLHRVTPTTGGEPSPAVFAGHAQVEQRVTLPHVQQLFFVRHAADLVGGETYPLFAHPAALHAPEIGGGCAEQFADLPVDGCELVLAGALSAAHAIGVVWVADEVRNGCVAVARVERVGSQVPVRHSNELDAGSRKGSRDAVELAVDSGRFPTCISENRYVWLRQCPFDREQG